mmetsp:Transcript_9959/g.22636  ORF Transcript_9959/g.22636 Transcript_9959/m.22636 type:complete len:203 (+) Transcript_9959:2451-3059(+)
MCHSLSRCSHSSCVRCARMSHTRGSSASLSIDPARTVNSRCKDSSTTSSKMGKIFCTCSNSTEPTWSVCSKCMVTRSMQEDLNIPLCPVRHHSITALSRPPLPIRLNGRSPLSLIILPYSGNSFAIRLYQLSSISRARFNIMSATARRTRLYSCRSTVSLKCSPSWPQRPARSVIDLDRRKNSLLTVIACLKYAPQNFSGCL